VKAVRIHGYGGPEVLTLEDIPRPQRTGKDILVKVCAAAINPVDCKLRAGRIVGYLDYVLPLTLGWDFSGVVAETGDPDSDFKVGASVYGLRNIGSDGSYAEYILTKSSEIAYKPANLSHVQAAVVPLGALTAWQALFDVGKLQDGQSALIHAGAGGVGIFAVQLAKWKGARVIATASARNEGLLRELGADQVIDYRATEFEKACPDVDLVLDSVGLDTVTRSWQVLKRDGILISITTIPSAEEARRHGVRAEFVFVHPDGQQLTTLATLLDSKKIRPIIEKVYSLGEIPEAHEQIQRGHVRGKLAVQIT
jgi:NADPH:quinone reductase-like Zn-dependent oxidoreductase